MLVVHVTDMPPRPDLEKLGVTYRRIPVMAIGSDLYFDTALMISELERRFTAEQGYTPLLNVHRGVQEASVAYWSDRALFPLSSGFMPVKVLSEALIKDRSAFNPAANFAQMEEKRPAAMSGMRTQLVRLRIILAAR